MAQLKKDSYGIGVLNEVNLVVLAYDNRKAMTDGVVTTRYLDMRVHPGDKRGPGQTNLALVSKRDPKSPSGFNNSARYSQSQFEAIERAAGDNVTDLTTQNGEVVGKIYGVKADLLISNGELIANTKSLQPTDLSVQDNAAGVDIRGQIFASQKAAKAANEAAKAAAASVETPAQETAAVEAPAVEEKKPAAKKAAAKKPAARKAAPKELVGAAAATSAPAVDEPALG